MSLDSESTTEFADQLAEISELPVTEQVAQYESLHLTLQNKLASIDGV